MEEENDGSGPRKTRGVIKKKAAARIILKNLQALKKEEARIRAMLREINVIQNILLVDRMGLEYKYMSTNVNSMRERAAKDQSLCNSIQAGTKQEDAEIVNLTSLDLRVQQQNDHLEALESEEEDEEDDEEDGVESILPH